MALGDTGFIPLDPKLFNDKDELSQLKSYILRRLGWPLIRVEITEDQLVDCILDAVNEYHEWAAMDYASEIVTVAGGNTVTIPDHIKSSDVVDIIFERDYYDSLASGMGMMGFDETLGGVLPYSLSGRSSLIKDFDIAGYYLYLRHMEDFKKALGIRDYFEIIDRKIRLFPANRRYRTIGILYKPMMNEAEAEQTNWIKRYSVAQAMIIVGTIRSKLGGFSSTGTNIAVDGSDMLNRGIEATAKLEEDIRLRGIPMPFIQS